MNYLYSLEGKVITGKKRGRNLGFPTANISLNNAIPEGIYISNVFTDEKNFPALTFIGRAVTFDEQELKAESYLLSEKIDLYGKWINVGLIKKIRDNKKFNSSEELVLQMKKDEEIARKYFKI